MQFDIFFSISHSPVNGYVPSERQVWQNFFSQVRVADELGYGTAWVAETHLSCQTQKENPGAVVPHFEGEIGLNTDVLQIATKVFAQTKQINVGSAIRNILCNGGPLAHAEAIRTFLSLHSLNPDEKRRINIGFASGRFPFSNVPYGIHPRNEFEKRAWPALRGLIFLQATEIFLRALKGEVFSQHNLKPMVLTRAHFRSEEDYKFALEALNESFANSWPQTAVDYKIKPKPLNREAIEIPSFWLFDKVGVIPWQAPLDLLDLTIGAHDDVSQHYANEFLPVGVFNLSITPSAQIEKTHERMQKHFNTARGKWTRAHMPRTVLVFIDNDPKKAQAQAQAAMEVYWRAMEGTLDPLKVANAVDNALVGTPEMIIEQMQKRFHADDRLMLWFDFNNYNSDEVCEAMKMFMNKVAPKFRGNNVR